MKRIIVSTCAMVMVVGATAQNQRQVGITLKTGVGEMRQVENIQNYALNNRIETKIAPSWGFGIYGRKQIKSKFSIESQAEYNQMNGIEEETYSYAVIQMFDDHSISTPHTVQAITQRKAHYLTLNSVFKFHPEENYSFGLGLTINYLISNSVMTQALDNGGPGYVIGSANDLNTLDLGLNPQFEYNLGDKLSVVAQAYFGLFEQRRDNYRDNYTSMTGFDSGQTLSFRNRQYTIGLHYTLFEDKIPDSTLD